MRSSRLGALAALAVLLASPVLAQNAAPSAAPAAPAAKAAPAAAATPSSALIDINTASKDTLDKLPQIGESRADAIIKGRPYKAKSDLIEKKVIPQNAYDAIKDRVVARQKS